VQRVSAPRHTEATALAGRKGHGTMVCTELHAVLVDDRAGHQLDALALKERGQLTAAEEAHLLALRRLRRGEALHLGLGDHVALDALAER
jgi:hypothetical protein